MKIVCDNKIPFLRGVFESCADVVYIPGDSISSDDVRDADALIVRTRTRCDRFLLEGSSVKVIATATIGYDHIDTEWVESAGIVWHNAPGCNSASVAQYVASVLSVLSIKHSIDLEGLTLGVVGVGNVGGKVAQVGESFGMKILLNDPPRASREGNDRFVSLDELVSCSDIISIHVPLYMDGENRTFHLFDEGRIADMKPDSFLINSSRGEVVDNAALRKALAENLIRGAVLDVWEGEPLIDSSFAGMLELATAHIAGYSADGKANGTGTAVRAVSEVLGLPLTDWTPSDIPLPEQSLEFSIESSDRRTALKEAVLHTYDVRNDSLALCSDCSAFERLRGEYPVRREFSAFRVNVSGNSLLLQENLKKLGFNITV